MPLIQTKKLIKTYYSSDQSLAVLKEVDLLIEAGEFVALTGPSGSGKTTLMHLLGCLDKPTSGQILLRGEEVSNFLPNRLAQVRNQMIGFVFQNFHLLNDLNAVENVALPLIYAGVNEKIAKRKAIELLEMVSLEDRLHHYPYQLSGGQKQRMAIARALAIDPPILLADEPTGNLDSENGERILDLFCTINSMKKTTVVVVTHEEKVARRARRCITILDGQIALDISQRQEGL